MKQPTAFFIIVLALGCQVVLAQESKQPTTGEAAAPNAADEASHYENLKDLEWMIGEWVDSDDNSTITTNCSWTKNRNFITRSFSVSIEGHIALEGTQVIGWDPEKKCVRSWLFDSEGGFGEATWLRKGNQWVIKASQVLKGGQRASSINVLKPVDQNTFTWRSIGREVDGELLPNIPEVTIVRKPPAKAQAPNARK